MVKDKYPYLASKHICKFLAFDHTMKDALPPGSRARLSPYPFTFKRCSVTPGYANTRGSLTQKRISIGILPRRLTIRICMRKKSFVLLPTDVKEFK